MLRNAWGQAKILAGWEGLVDNVCWHVCLYTCSFLFAHMCAMHLCDVAPYPIESNYVWTVLCQVWSEWMMRRNGFVSMLYSQPGASIGAWWGMHNLHNPQLKKKLMICSCTCWARKSFVCFRHTCFWACATVHNMSNYHACAARLGDTKASENMLVSPKIYQSTNTSLMFPWCHSRGIPMSKSI